jgi:hypothetical protein
MTYYLYSRPKDAHPLKRMERVRRFSTDDIIVARAERDRRAARFPNTDYSVKDDCGQSCDTYPVVADDGLGAALLAFAQQVANFKLYGAEMADDGDDAMQCLNDLIEEARDLLHVDPHHPPFDPDADDADADA